MIEFIMSLIAAYFHKGWTIWTVYFILAALLAWFFFRDSLWPAPFLLLMPFTLIFYLPRHFVAVPIINHYGIEARATVVSSKKTFMTVGRRGGTSYDVYWVTAMFRTQDGKLVEVKYHHDSRFIYPRKAGAFLPRKIGEEFDIKYLPLFPKRFVEVRDISEWEYEDKLMEAEQKYLGMRSRLAFDPDNTSLQAEVKRLKAEVEAIKAEDPRKK